MIRLPAPLRRPWLAGLMVAVVACGSDSPAGPPFGPDAIVYRIQPQLISYLYTDTTAGQDFHLDWLSDTTYFGRNCIGFTPRSAIDTIGTFQFFAAGGNQGYIERTIAGTKDTVPGVFLTGEEGTGGSYVLESSGRVTLTWQDGGTITRYFDPAATLRFSGDTLRATADLRFRGDSIRALWDVSWIVANCD
jgi:hypothetical protein